MFDIVGTAVVANIGGFVKVMEGFLEGTQQDFFWSPELQYFRFSGASEKSDIVRRV